MGGGRGEGEGKGKGSLRSTATAVRSFSTHSRYAGLTQGEAPTIRPCSASRAAFHLCCVSQCMHAITLEQGVLTIYWVFVV